MFKLRSLNLFSIFLFNKPEEKTGEGEQKEELESDLAEVALQAEESPPSIPTEDNESTQSKDNLSEDREDVSTETQQTASQPNPGRIHSGRGRPPKTTPPSAQKKVSVKKEEGNATQDAPEFQDDPSDADYMPSKYIFIESLLICPIRSQDALQWL